MESIFVWLKKRRYPLHSFDNEWQCSVVMLVFKVHDGWLSRGRAVTPTSRVESTSPPPTADNMSPEHDYIVATNGVASPRSLSGVQFY